MMRPSAFLLLACSAVLAWIHAHPLLVAFCVTAAISVAYERLDKYPRIHGIFVALAGLGFDLPKVIGGVTQALTGRPYVPAKPSTTYPPPVLHALPLFLVVGFVGACTPPKSPDAARSEARAAVLATKTAWLVASNSCVAFATAAHDDKIRQKCDAVLEPAYKDMMAAGAAVDAWPTLDGGEPAGDVACKLASALDAIAHSPALLQAVGDAGAQPLALTQAGLDSALAAASLLPGFGECHD